MADVLSRKLPGGGTPESGKLKKGAGSRGASPLRNASPAAPKARSRTGTPIKGESGATKTPAKGGAAGTGKGKRPPSAPAPGTFEASKKFDGERPGFVFKNGPHGVGYYLDEANGWALSIPELERSLAESRAAGIEVCALVFAHPQAEYFNVGQINKDQVIKE